MKKRVLITGIKGMAGSHLLDFLLASEDEYIVFGNDLIQAESFIEANEESFDYVDYDIRILDEMRRLFQWAEPEWVFHLAAEPFVPDSWEDPIKVIDTNLQGTATVLLCAKEMKNPPIVQIAGSSEEYGMVYPNEIPINPKTQPFRPLSPYGVSKVAAEYLAKQFSESYGLRTVVTRTFNHTGPRQKREYVTSDFCLQALELLTGPLNFIKHGNLQAVRDFTDVRDIVRGYVEAVKWTEKTNIKGKVFQLGGGEVCSIRRLLEMVCEETNLSLENNIRLDKNRLRPSDVPILCCDNSEFTLLTGWRPVIPFKRTVNDVLKYWRARLL